MDKFSDLLNDKSLQEDWARIVVLSCGRQFDLHGIIYHMQPYNVDNKRCNVFFTNRRRSKVSKNTWFSPNKSYGKF